MANMFKNAFKNKPQEPESVFPNQPKKEKKDFIPKASHEEVVEAFKKDVSNLNQEQLNKIVLQLEDHRDELERRLKPEGYQELIKDLKEKGH